MNILNSLARQARTAEIISINSALISILQDRLRVNEIQVYDRIDHEIGIIKQYLTIINYRYENSVTVHWDVSSDLMQSEIPKNLIQPLIENAYFHGLIHEDGTIGGDLYIRIYRQKSAIIIEVEDTGCGIEPDKIIQIHSAINAKNPTSSDRGNHIGMKNVRDRLSYLYRNKDCIRINSIPGQGTKVTLILQSDLRRDLNT